MEATPTLVINYYSGFKQNLVPLFQRPYTWSEKQWRTLWDDVMVFYPSDVKDNATHFMGAVVTMPARSVPVGVSKFLIIDGQQRLTTISLLMCAVRDVLPADQQTRWRHIQHHYLTNDGSEGTEVFKLLPTQGDRGAYASLIQVPVANVPDSQVKKSYDFFRRRLRDVAEDGEKIDPKRILEIIEKRLMVVMINLSETDDPYLIFESLNFKGSPLEQADLVRNYFLMRFLVADQQGIYDGLWLPMQTRLGTNLTEFMRHFLGAEGEEARKGDVYAAIRRLVADSDSASVKLLMTRMERLSAMYDRLSSPLGVEPQAELSRFFDHFRRLDFGSVYPLLLTLYEDYADGQFGIEEFVATLGILQSFILRRMVVGVPSNSLSGLFISLCKTKPVTEVPSAWLSAMLARENKNRRWPTDIEFAERWMHAPLYGSRACQVILECLEESYGHHEVVAFADSSIEHVMPQTLTPEWYEMLGTDATSIHTDWLHTIGNLTLTGYNPELGNRSYTEKRGTYALSHFELNRCFGECETWRSPEIGNRAEALFKIALKLWPRPEVTIIDAPVPSAPDKKAPAAFHGDCIKIVQQYLGVPLAKVSKSRYQSGDGRIRVMCAVSDVHDEAKDVPYFWFGFHVSQLEFLRTAEVPYVCFGCASAETTLPVPLASILSFLDSMSVSVVAQHRHVVVKNKMGKFILRLLDGKDGPDLTGFNIGSGPLGGPVVKH